MIIRKPGGSRKRPVVNNRAEQEILALTDQTEKTFSISVFLDLVNTGLRTFDAKVRGEVTSVVERGGHYYFNLKDKEDGSTLNCLIWGRNYRVCGVQLAEGMEIVAHGFPSVYKPNGRLSFQADSLELQGDGALLKQFEELKARLAGEGLFAPERKKPIPLFPEKIGLITSRQGEAIHDFSTNLGRFGFKISFIDSRVEGVQAVPLLLSAIRRFKKADIDVLVLVRGGGSLESLLSFNNEALVREIAAFPKPVVSGIGHEQDVSLVDLVADRSTSTPTGAAKLLSYGWEQARARVDLAERQIRSSFREDLHRAGTLTRELGLAVRDDFRRLLDGFKRHESRLKEELAKQRGWLASAGEIVKRSSASLRGAFPRLLSAGRDRLAAMEKALSLSDPSRQLKLGYVLAHAGGKLVRSVEGIFQGEKITLQLQDGDILSEVINIDKHGK
ncbi:MAG: exodeoxyribonuclease VII large subunit [Candidatus Vogelbacteria bacterium]|nr:exodeoxyribonuclease VII large subunit [Candidatus Vogelbacteria bacterium]